MFNLRFVFVLAVVLVISIRCEDEKNQKEVPDAQIPANNVTSNVTTSPDDTPFVVNNQTEIPIIISTVPDATTLPTSKPTIPTTDAPIPTTNGTTPTPPITTPSTTPTTSTVTTSTDAPTTTTTPAPITNATTTSSTTPPSPTPKTSTTAKPVVPTTSEPPPHKDRHFDGASFIGGIILALGLMGIGFIAFKFYKARTDRNYHTL